MLTSMVKVPPRQCPSSAPALRRSWRLWTAQDCSLGAQPAACKAADLTAFMTLQVDGVLTFNDGSGSLDPRKLTTLSDLVKRVPDLHICISSNLACCKGSFWWWLATQLTTLAPPGWLLA